MPRGHGRGGGGRGGPGMKGGRKVVVVPHKHDGVFITKAKEDPLCTKNMVAGESVYGKKSVSVQLFCNLFNYRAYDYVNEARDLRKKKLFLPMFMSRSITVGVQGMPLIVLSLLSVTNLDSEFFQNSIILD
ncbi:hypothetical protein CFC21_112700 [Triticum aestivum]|uniref:Uncharacterized protein n=2 Tax=Triticum aestivum TaxID=4565 RepID=A0A3B6IP12_WHEAT|nr:hypothetical protein [Triticum aestivum]